MRYVVQQGNTDPGVARPLDWSGMITQVSLHHYIRLLTLHSFNRHSENRCLELDEPEYLIDEPSLGEVTLAQCNASTASTDITRASV